METFNPFPTNKYLGAEYFCNRNLEKEQLENALHNGRNITLFSLRKLGKTGLISHLFNENNSIKSEYIDILHTQNELQFAEIFIQKVLTAIESKPEKLFRWVKGAFSKLSPVLEFDAQTGVPNLSVKLADNDITERSLDELFTFLSKWDGELWLAIDEFQQITQYPETGLEAKLRSWIQFCPGLKWIFSGSKEHMLVSMFSDYGRPFYQGADLLKLQPIAENEYVPFIIGHMEAGKRVVDEEVIRTWYRKMHGHTYYIQYCMNLLYAARPKNWKQADYNEFFKDLVFRQEPYFITYKNLLTNLQWDIVKAMAKESHVEKIQSKDWIQKYKLGTPSSVAAAVKLLNEREIIALDEKGYRLMNPLMEHWIQYVRL